MALGPPDIVRDAVQWKMRLATERRQPKEAGAEGLLDRETMANMGNFFKEHETAAYIIKGVGSATAGVVVGFAIICLLRFFELVPGSPEDVRTTICLLGLLWLAMVVMRLYMGLSGKWRE